jgi:DNA repair protein RadC
MQASIKFQKVPFKSWSSEDKPREKLLTRGSEYLSDAEILANIIGSGTAQLSPVDIARLLLQSVDHDLRKLSQLHYEQLTAIPGIGRAKALAILSALELGRRRASTAPKSLPKIALAKDAYEVIKPHLTDFQYEQIWALLLNSKSQVVAIKKLTTGNLSESLMNTKELLREMILTPYVANAILVHPHPSQNPKPSASDIRMTKAVAEALRLSGFTLFDHIIFCEDSFFSFLDEGLL